MDSHGRRRRDVLGASASAVLAALAGCTGESAPAATTSEAPAGNDSGGSAPGDGPGAAGNGTATTRDDGANAGDGLVLPSLDVGGSPGGLVELRPAGRVVLLNFFATWCPPCDPEMDNLRAVRNEFDPSELFVVSITQESDEAAVETFWEENRGTWPVVTDSGARAMRRYDVTTIPTIVALAPDGTEVERHTGLVGEDDLVAAVEAARDGGEAG